MDGGLKGDGAHPGRRVNLFQHREQAVPLQGLRDPLSLWSGRRRPVHLSHDRLELRDRDQLLHPA